MGPSVLSYLCRCLGESRGSGGHLRIADEREVEEDDIVLSHGKVMLHCGLLQGDLEILLDHAAAAYGKVVELRLAQIVAKAVQGACMQQPPSLSTAGATFMKRDKGSCQTLLSGTTLLVALQPCIAVLAPGLCSMPAPSTLAQTLYIYIYIWHHAAAWASSSCRLSFTKSPRPADSSADYFKGATGAYAAAEGASLWGLNTACTSCRSLCL